MTGEDRGADKVGGADRVGGADLEPPAPGAGFRWEARGRVWVLHAAGLEEAFRAAGRRLVAAVSSRPGGVSPPPWNGLNCGRSVGDEPARVGENRRRLGDAVGVPPDRWAIARQVHGNAVAYCRQPALPEAPEGVRALPAADILVAGPGGPALVVFTADCVPVLVGDPASGGVALAHAGWRGTALGAAATAVEALGSAFHAPPGRLRAAIGPSIGPCCYQVDRPVADALAARYPDAERLLTPDGPDHWRLDLWAANVADLERAGVPPAQVAVAGLCTACHRGWFFSHRAERGKTGRLAALLHVG